MLSKIKKLLGLGTKDVVILDKHFPKKHLEEVEGIGKKHAGRLKQEGIENTADLLSVGATVSGRNKIAKATGYKSSTILTWVNHVDLYRINGVGEEYADLLEASGVDTVVELARRKPANLHAKMSEVNEKKKLVRQLPAEKTVADWISQADKLPRIVHH